MTKIPTHIFVYIIFSLQLFVCANNSVNISLTQKAFSGKGVTNVDLSAHGDLDWAAWDGGASAPNQTMSSGGGFVSFSAIGSTSFAVGNFDSANNYTWTNGAPTSIGSSTLSGSASIANTGDGVRLVVSVANAGDYQLKFYASTYDLNLDATASLSSAGIQDVVNGSYVANAIQRYEYTIDFSTQGSDTLSLDLVKNGGGQAIFAHEAFSLKTLTTVPPPIQKTHETIFINVDGTETVETIHEGGIAVPPSGVSTADKTFTGWPNVKPASQDVTYTALYTDKSGAGNYVDVFMATGQSNAFWPVDPESSGSEGLYYYGKGVEDVLANSGLFSDPVVVIDGEPGEQISNWHDGSSPQWIYKKQFFGTYDNTTAKLQAKLAQIISEGGVPRFRGLFWFQGESDGVGTPPYQNNTCEFNYANRWRGLLNQVEADLQDMGLVSDQYKFVMNTVGNSGEGINTALMNISNGDSKGVLFDTQVAPYRTNFSDIHGYDHDAVGQANVQLFINTFITSPPPITTYSIKFINVDGSQVSTTVNAGEVPVPPEGVDTDIRSFLSWPSISNAYSDATYTALYILKDGGSKISINLNQEGYIGPGLNDVNLTDHGNLDWAAWDGGAQVPNQSMLDGVGFGGIEAIASATFSSGAFESENNYVWSNGDPSELDCSVLAGRASFNAIGDGVRLTVNVSDEGNYQVKFYASTYDLNLKATASLASAGVTEELSCNYVSSNLERYEYTIDFRTEGADTFFLDISKISGTDIFAHEAFSFKKVTLPTPATSSYEIIFVNVDGSTSTQLVDEGWVAVPPAGVDTDDKIFRAWPEILPAVENVTYTALYDYNQYTVTFDLGIASLESGELVQTVTHGGSAQAPEIIVPISHNFVDWSADFLNITGDLTVVAQFAIKNYNVSFDLGAGTRIGGGELSQSIAYGSGAVEPSINPPNGYAHTGWDLAFDNITADLTVTALYESKQLQLSSLTMTNPSSHTLTWTALDNTAYYYLAVGTSEGMDDLYGMYLDSDVTTVDLNLSGYENVYVRLWTYANGEWHIEDSVITDPNFAPANASFTSYTGDASELTIKWNRSTYDGWYYIQLVNKFTLEVEWSDYFARTSAEALVGAVSQPLDYYEVHIWSYDMNLGQWNQDIKDLATSENQAATYSSHGLDGTSLTLNWNQSNYLGWYYIELERISDGAFIDGSYFDWNVDSGVFDITGTLVNDIRVRIWTYNADLGEWNSSQSDLNTP
ncbi:hypothetical protein LNTAR_22624 [Lentisphaera araneosa HTCC2155]|uniref:Uncharacterized protein n=1 Tax=Lentisphaera araneosa HTCC2155 TaxID=313628 RepID=A6DGB6_9BACT|nr:hypothetical protein [Lentisphaera araneosa]EDM29233.1 hypothetical protein LNTAR_22624 [Lentisphaera araneosa HTCC2155]